MAIRHSFLFLGFLLLGLFIFGAGQVMAHTRLLSSNPADGETIEGQTPYIILDFSTAPEAGYSRIELATTPSGNLKSGNQALLNNESQPSKPEWPGKPKWINLESQQSGKRVQANLPQLSAGRYRIRWSVLSSDGHRQNGTINFMVH